jgi:hypothetical protein
VGPVNLNRAVYTTGLHIFATKSLVWVFDCYRTNCHSESGAGQNIEARNPCSGRRGQVRGPTIRAAEEGVNIASAIFTSDGGPRGMRPPGGGTGASIANQMEVKGIAFSQSISPTRTEPA